MAITFFKTPQKTIIATQCKCEISNEDIQKLCWLYGEATPEQAQSLTGFFIGPRREMVTPWSTNAVEITQNMNIQGIVRIEEYFPVESEEAEHDPMLQRLYRGLDQDIFTVDIKPAPIRFIDDLDAYNEQEGLARCSASHKSTRSIAVTRYSAARSSSTGRRRKAVCSR